MIEINLLSWRENKKQKEIKKFKQIAFLFTTFILILSVMIHLFLSHYQDQLQEHLFELTQNVNHVATELPSLSQSADLAAETSKIKNDHEFLQKIYHFLTSPQKLVRFTEIKNNHESMVFTGKALSTLNLTHFLMNWQAASYFSKIELENLQKQEKNNEILFRFRAFR